MDNRLIKLLCSLLVLLLLSNCIPDNVLVDEIITQYFYSVTSNLEYEVSLNTTSSWSGHTNVNLVLTNTGTETIHNWYLTFNACYNIDNIWNGSVFETDGSGIYTITSNGWNQDILSSCRNGR